MPLVSKQADWEAIARISMMNKSRLIMRLVSPLHDSDGRMESCPAEHQERDYGPSTDHVDEVVTIQRIRQRNPSSFFHISASIIACILLCSHLPVASPSINADDSQTGTRRQQQQSDDDIILGSSTSSPFRIVIDAGSTGSRLHIFEMVSTGVSSSSETSSDSSSTFSMSTRIECMRRGSSKAWTPLSAFAPSYHDENNADNAQHSGDNNKRLNATHVAHHMLSLFDYASVIIPNQYHSTTPVRIAATAGMRLVSPNEQLLVYDALYEGLMEQQVPQGQFTFVNLKREDVMTLDGEREAYFGAVAANYLRGVIDAELRVIVHDDEVEEDAQEQNKQKGTQNDNENEKGMCTNKFKMCEQDAENIVFGPSPHYVSQQRHDVRAHGPLGALDMGGSSTQIVYRRNINSNREHGGHHKLTFQRGTSSSLSSPDSEDDEGNKYDIPSHLNDDEFFSTSYLSYGADQFRERLWDLWVTEATKQRQGNTVNSSPPVIVNPCSFVGYENEYRGYLLRGTGDAILCAEQINRLIPHHDNVIDLDELFDENLEAAQKHISSTEEQHKRAETKRKIVGGVEHPPIHGKFYGMSLYFFTLDCLRELSDPDHPIHLSWPTPSIEELTHALDGFCSRKWQGDLEEVQHEAHEHTRAEVLPHRCVEAVYMVTLLRDGFGFHPSSRDITFTQWVDGNEVEWSLGMALSEFATERRREEEGRSIHKS
ncbi:hypothetical protein ACHAXM_006694 [Skeletonema potamos]|jgi:hypothetical protein